MRDQNFQELMSKHTTLLPHNGPNSVSETQANNVVGESKPSSSNIIDELDSQISFAAFLKRNIPNRKPSPALIQSLKGRIKMIEFPDSAI